jgi:hypothetical protein
MAETPEKALSRGFAPVRSSEAEVDAHYSANGAQHEQKDAAFDPHIVEEIAVGIGAQLCRKQGNTDLRTPAQAHHGRYE